MPKHPKSPASVDASPGSAGGSHSRRSAATGEKTSPAAASHCQTCRTRADRAPFSSAEHGPIARLLHVAGACVEARREAHACAWPTVAAALDACSEPGRDLAWVGTSAPRRLERPEWIAWWCAREAFALGPRVALAWLAFLRAHTLARAIGRAALVVHGYQMRDALRIVDAANMAERSRSLRRGPWPVPTLADVLELEALTADIQREPWPELEACARAALGLRRAARELLAFEGSQNAAWKFADASADAAYACSVLLDRGGPRCTAAGLLRWRDAIPEAWRIEIGSPHVALLEVPGAAQIATAVELADFVGET